MATRSAIAIADGDRLTAVYVHWDGYLSGVGRTLLDHWNHRSAVRTLIRHGDISSLGAGLGVKHDFDGPRSVVETTFYGRDRGELDTEPSEFANAEEFVREMSHRGCEFFYIFGWDDQWWVSCDYGPLEGTWCLLGESFQKVREFEPEVD